MNVRLLPGKQAFCGTAPLLAVLALALFVMAGCAAGPNELADTPDDDGSVAGFWHGLWHGFILLFTFIISLFTDKVHVYDVHNSGNWYNLGFFLGALMFFSGNGHQAGKRSRKKRTCESRPDSRASQTD